jgi:hypothetical protein
MRKTWSENELSSHKLIEGLSFKILRDYSDTRVLDLRGNQPEIRRVYTGGVILVINIDG